MPNNNIVCCDIETNITRSIQRPNCLIGWSGNYTVKISGGGAQWT